MAPSAFEGLNMPQIRRRAPQEQKEEDLEPQDLTPVSLFPGLPTLLNEGILVNV